MKGKEQENAKKQHAAKGKISTEGMESSNSENQARELSVISPSDMKIIFTNETAKKNSTSGLAKAVKTALGT